MIELNDIRVGKIFINPFMFASLHTEEDGTHIITRTQKRYTVIEDADWIAGEVNKIIQNWVYSKQNFDSVNG